LGGFDILASNKDLPRGPADILVRPTNEERKWGRWVQPGNLLALTTTCRQIYHDTMLLPFIFNMFDALRVPGFLRLIQRLSREKRNAITTIRVPMFNAWLCDPTLRQALRMLPGLKRVVIDKDLTLYMVAKTPVIGVNERCAESVKKLMIATGAEIVVE
jgi:hypothetical protein